MDTIIKTSRWKLQLYSCACRSFFVIILCTLKIATLFHVYNWATPSSQSLCLSYSLSLTATHHSLTPWDKDTPASLTPRFFHSSTTTWIWRGGGLRKRIRWDEARRRRIQPTPRPPPLPFPLPPWIHHNVKSCGEEASSGRFDGLELASGGSKDLAGEEPSGGGLHDKQCGCASSRRFQLMGWERACRWA